MSNSPKGETDLLTAVLTLRKKGFTYRAISAKTGVSSTTVFNWVRNFAPENREPMRSKPYKGRRIAGARAPERRAEQEPSAPASAEAETLEEKVRRLERELEDARLEADLCNAIIDIAEKKFKIAIRKKAGARR